MGDSQHTQNIQINKVIGENEKCVFYFMEKPNRLLSQPSIRIPCTSDSGSELSELQVGFTH